MVAAPHYLLFSEANCSADRRTWRFVLQDVESRRRMVVSDEEAMTCGERLELLAVVRGLEALDGPARVTLVTKSRYVSRGLRFGMTEWRANDWQWERFGRIVPVKDHDLWQRVDRALLFHEVECQAWQFGTNAKAGETLSAQESDVVDVPTARASVAIASSVCEEGATFDRMPGLANGCLAPTKRRLARSRHIRKQRNLAGQCADHETTLTASLASKAASLRESLQNLVTPVLHMATGAA